MRQRLFVIAVASLLAVSACDANKPSDDSTRPADERPQGAVPASPASVPEEHRAQYQAELDRARKLQLELPVDEQRAKNAVGNRALDEAIAAFSQVDAEQLERDFFEAMRDGEQLPTLAVELVHRHGDKLDALREALRHTTYEPRISRAGEPINNDPSQAVYTASRLLAASGAVDSPKACLERAADTLRLAFASSYGMGYLGAFKQNALAQWGVAAATGCMPRASEEVQQKAAATFDALDQARPALASATYFEWLVQISRLTPIATGASDDPEITTRNAVQAISHRVQHLDRVRELSEHGSYGSQLEDLQALLDQGKGNIVFEMDREFFSKVLNEDIALQEEIEKLSGKTDPSD